MTRWLATVIVASTLVPACSRDSSRATDSSARAPVATVRWFGALHEIMAEGRTAARVRISDAALGPHLFGVGALGQLGGEVTIVDDIAWLARPNDDGTVSIGNTPVRDAHDGAALLVVANVASWREWPIAGDVPWADLDAYLGRQIEGGGYSRRDPIPVIIRGPLKELRWHVVNGTRVRAGADHRAHLEGSIAGHVSAAPEDATLIGFYSREHEGVFTHHGSFSHFHVVSPASSVAAHVDGVAVLEGARLRLPAP